MAVQRGLVVDIGRILDVEEGKDPTGKNFKADKFPPLRWESAVALGVFLLFSIGLMSIYLTMPAAEYKMLKLPRTLADLRLLKK